MSDDKLTLINARASQDDNRFPLTKSPERSLERNTSQIDSPFKYPTQPALETKESQLS